MAKKKTPKKVSEFILNCLPSKDTEPDWSMGDACEAGLLASTKVPPSKDLRATWWKIHSQGNTGSCVGWAVADSVLRWHFVKQNQLEKDELISVRYIWMASKETDEFTTRATTFIERDGTSIKAALDVARKHGIVTEAMLPFEGGKLYQDKANTFYAQAAQRRISSYFNLGRNLAKWREWIANTGPIVSRLDVDATWENASSTNGKLDAYQPLTAHGGHAIALVGYTPDHFIVRNSWGKDWGDKGFAYASNAYATAAFTEAYGVMI